VSNQIAQPEPEMKRFEFFSSSTVNITGNYSLPNVMFVTPFGKILVPLTCSDVDLPTFKVKWSKMYGNPLCVQKIICGRAMNDYVTLNSQMHSNALFTFVRERERSTERKRERNSLPAS
jgi:hypothetical protein